jgi:hypothetical protein
MRRDRLFLLAPGFSDAGKREYCPECAELWGLLNYYPSIKESVDIEYQSIERPRADLVELLGPEHQNCPTLLLNEFSPTYAECGIKAIEGLQFIDNARDIGMYYAHRFGTPYPRGH